MIYTKNGIDYEFVNPLSSEDLQKFLNGELEGILVGNHAISQRDFDILQQDIIVGKNLVLEFLTDNRNPIYSFDVVAVNTLLAQFSKIKVVLESGDLKNSKKMLEVILPDSVLTQERKAKYLKIISDYLESKE